MHIWDATVWAAVASGLVDVGLTVDTATKLRAWHAAKIRAVLNKPAHLTHISTSDLYRQYGIKDPVQKLADRQANRVKRLEHRSRVAHPDDVWFAPCTAGRDGWTKKNSRNWRRARAKVLNVVIIVKSRARAAVSFS